LSAHRSITAARTRCAPTLQDSLDSTALMLAKEAPNETSAVLQANAVKYFNALFNEAGASGI
jgi:hypothetical protein